MTDMELDVLENIKGYAGQDFYKFGLQYWAEKYWADYLNTEGYDLSDYL